MKKPELVDCAWYYTFKRKGETITVISRMYVCDFETLHDVWVEDMWEVV